MKRASLWSTCGGLLKLMLLGIRFVVCALLPIAVLLTEWYLLDLGSVARGSMFSLMYVLLIYLSVPLALLCGLLSLGWLAVRGIQRGRLPPTSALIGSFMAMSPSLLLIASKTIDLDDYGFLHRHEQELKAIADGFQEPKDGFGIFWQDDDFVVIDVRFLFGFSGATCFAYCRSADDEANPLGVATSRGAESTDRAMARLRTAWPQSYHNHLRGPWSQVTVFY